MSALWEILKVVRKLDVQVFYKTSNLIEIWSMPAIIEDEFGAWDEPAKLIGSIAGGGEVIEITSSDVLDYPARTIGQLRQFTEMLSWSGGHPHDLIGIELVYRKTVAGVEVDIVSISLDYWNYIDEQGFKVQALGTTEYHRGPDIRAVEARLIYDPARNVLRAR